MKLKSDIRNDLAERLRAELNEFLFVLGKNQEYEYYAYDIADQILARLEKEEVLTNIEDDL